MGHLAVTGMIHMLRRAGAQKEILKRRELFKRQACSDAQHAKHPRVSRYGGGNYSFNVAVSADAFAVHGIVGDPWCVLNIVCEGATYR
eukprot:13881747-Alexandrium_andersonii.AAC.1